MPCAHQVTGTLQPLGLRRCSEILSTRSVLSLVTSSSNLGGRGRRRASCSQLPAAVQPTVAAAAARRQWQQAPQRSRDLNRLGSRCATHDQSTNCGVSLGCRPPGARVLAGTSAPLAHGCSAASSSAAAATRSAAPRSSMAGMPRCLWQCLRRSAKARTYAIGQRLQRDQTRQVAHRGSPSSTRHVMHSGGRSGSWSALSGSRPSHSDLPYTVWRAATRQLFLKWP